MDFKVDTNGNISFPQETGSNNTQLWRHSARVYHQNYGPNYNVDDSHPDDSISSDLQEQWGLAEAMYNNSPIYAAIIKKLVAHTLLGGFSCAFKTGDEETDLALYKVFKKWSKCVDPTNRTSFNDMIGIYLLNYYLYGEGLGYIVGDTRSFNSGGFATKVRGINRTQLASPGNRANKNSKVVHGIELSEFGDPLKLWIRGSRGAPTSKKWFDDEGNPLVLHMIRQEHWGQTHGKCPITPVYNSLLGVHKFISNEIQASSLGSAFNMVTKLKNPGERFDALPSLNTGTDDAPNYTKLWQVNPGTPIPLNKDEELEQLKLERPIPGFSDFVDKNLKLICSGMGYSYEYIFCDWADSNSASARVNAIQTQETLKANQNLLIQQVLKPLVDSMIREAHSTDRMPDKLDVEEILESYSVVAPKLPLLDPQKEIATIKQKLDMNLTTLEREAERLNEGDWEALVKQRGKELGLIRSEGASESEEQNLDQNGEPTLGVGKPPGENSTRS